MLISPFLIVVLSTPLSPINQFLVYMKIKGLTDHHFHWFISYTQHELISAMIIIPIVLTWLEGRQPNELCGWPCFFVLPYHSLWMFLCALYAYYTTVDFHTSQDIARAMRQTTIWSFSPTKWAWTPNKCFLCYFYPIHTYGMARIAVVMHTYLPIGVFCIPIFSIHLSNELIKTYHSIALHRDRS